MWKRFSFASVCRVPSFVLVRALNRYRGGHGFVSSTSLIFFFRLSFRNCKSCLYNCNHRGPTHNLMDDELYGFVLEFIVRSIKGFKCN